MLHNRMVNCQDMSVVFHRSLRLELERRSRGDDAQAAAGGPLWVQNRGERGRNETIVMGWEYLHSA